MRNSGTNSTSTKTWRWRRRHVLTRALSTTNCLAALGTEPDWCRFWVPHCVPSAGPPSRQQERRFPPPDDSAVTRRTTYRMLRPARRWERERTAPVVAVNTTPRHAQRHRIILPHDTSRGRKRLTSSIPTFQLMFLWVMSLSETLETFGINGSTPSTLRHYYYSKNLPLVGRWYRWQEFAKSLQCNRAIMLNLSFG